MLYFFLGLSGVIIDEDDDQSLPPASSSPSNQRVAELKTSEGGGSGKGTPISNPGSIGSGKNTPVKKVSFSSLVALPFDINALA